MSFLSALGKWIAGLFLEKGLQFLKEKILKFIDMMRRKKETDEAVEELKKAETEEEIKQATRRIADRWPSD